MTTKSLLANFVMIAFIVTLQFPFAPAGFPDRSWSAQMHKNGPVDNSDGGEKRKKRNEPKLRPRKSEPKFWGTPRANMPECGGLSRNHNIEDQVLHWSVNFENWKEQQMNNEMWPTPLARDWKNPSNPDGHRARRKAAEGWTKDLNDFAVEWSAKMQNNKHNKPPEPTPLSTAYSRAGWKVYYLQPDGDRVANVQKFLCADGLKPAVLFVAGKPFAVPPNTPNRHVIFLKPEMWPTPVACADSRANRSSKKTGPGYPPWSPNLIDKVQEHSAEMEKYMAKRLQSSFPKYWPTPLAIDANGPVGPGSMRAMGHLPNVAIAFTEKFKSFEELQRKDNSMIPESVSLLYVVDTDPEWAVFFRDQIVASLLVQGWQFRPFDAGRQGPVKVAARLHEYCQTPKAWIPGNSGVVVTITGEPFTPAALFKMSRGRRGVRRPAELARMIDPHPGVRVIMTGPPRGPWLEAIKLLAGNGRAVVLYKPDGPEVPDGTKAKNVAPTRPAPEPNGAKRASSDATMPTTTNKSDLSPDAPAKAKQQEVIKVAPVPNPSTTTDMVNTEKPAPIPATVDPKQESAIIVLDSAAAAAPPITESTMQSILKNNRNASTVTVPEVTPATIDAAIIRALFHTSGAAERWRGALLGNDSAVREFLSKELGLGGGSGGPNMLEVAYRGGANPRVVISTKPGGDVVLELRGKKLVQEARRAVSAVLIQHSAQPKALPASTANATTENHNDSRTHIHWIDTSAGQEWAKERMQQLRKQFPNLTREHISNESGPGDWAKFTQVAASRGISLEACCADNLLAEIERGMDGGFRLVPKGSVDWKAGEIVAKKRPDVAFLHPAQVEIGQLANADSKGKESQATNATTAAPETTAVPPAVGDVPSPKQAVNAGAVELKPDPQSGSSGGQNEITPAKIDCAIFRALYAHNGAEDLWRSALAGNNATVRKLLSKLFRRGGGTSGPYGLSVSYRGRSHPYIIVDRGLGIVLELKGKMLVQSARRIMTAALTVLTPPNHFTKPAVVAAMVEAQLLGTTVPSGTSPVTSPTPLIPAVPQRESEIIVAAPAPNHEPPITPMSAPITNPDIVDAAPAPSSPAIPAISKAPKRCESEITVAIPGTDQPQVEIPTVPAEPNSAIIIPKNELRIDPYYLSEFHRLEQEEKIDTDHLTTFTEWNRAKANIVKGIYPTSIVMGRGGIDKGWDFSHGQYSKLCIYNNTSLCNFGLHITGYKATITPPGYLLIVLDDINAALKDQDAGSWLKSACGTTNARLFPRVINRESKKILKGIPNSYKLKSPILLATNVFPTRINPDLAATFTRAKVFIFNPPPEEIHAYVGTYFMDLYKKPGERIYRIVDEWIGELDHTHNCRIYDSLLNELRSKRKNFEQWAIRKLLAKHFKAPELPKNEQKAAAKLRILKGIILKVAGTGEQLREYEKACNDAKIDGGSRADFNRFRDLYLQIQQGVTG